MVKIIKFTCEEVEYNCVTDNLHPCFSYILESDKNNVSISKVIISVGEWRKEVVDEVRIVYDGPKLKPFSSYKAKIEVVDSDNDTAVKTVDFETGFYDEKWNGKWISDGEYIFKEKRCSPKIMTFKKRINIRKEVEQIRLYSTALGIYDVKINNKKVGERYFAPGFTSYKSFLQYQTYDLTSKIKDGDELSFVISGGWAVGSFVFTRANRITAPRQALLCEMHILYKDGTKEIVGSDTSWQVTEEGNVLEADFYDGETYDANVDINKINYRQATYEKISISPRIIAEYGSPVIRHETMKAEFIKTGSKGELIFDFKQNFAGVINIRIKNAKKGQVIIIKHAEILTPEGDLNTVFLRTAKATLKYICREGKQEYSPTFTYMGFRYISVEGIDIDDFEISGYALYSDIEQIGDFSCSSGKLNKLQSNICWSAKSNFMDIPTDCPQRDERMGWTGDIAIFSPTACFNFDVSRFLSKWLVDVKAEQRKTGGIPNTVPSQSYGFPTTMPLMAIDFWGDACVLVPWALYQSNGDKRILEYMYESMKKYVDACAFWARLFSFGKNRYIWHTLSMFHFGDWVAPDVPKMQQWQQRSKWTATASLKNTSRTLALIAHILKKKDDEKHYDRLANKVSNAYIEKFTNRRGRLLNEFQTGYVLPLYFQMFNANEQKEAASNLEKLVKKNDYCIGTGFPGTPYILFALADNNKVDTAYKMLLNTKCPSWLYEVEVGGTTIWERWDGLNEKGVCEIGSDGTGGMISFNHYASGAVGDFLYRRVAGIEAIKPGYKEFKIAPICGGGLTYAKASTLTNYGKISSSWKIEDGKFIIDVEVPINTTCQLILPSGRKRELLNGKYSYSEKYQGD